MVYTGYRGDSRYAPFQTDRYEIDGRRYIVERFFDDCGDMPWENNDGAGYVTDWQAKSNKRPGHRILCEDNRGRDVRFYDWQNTMKKARKDGWGLDDDAKAVLAKRLKREPTKGDILVEAVERDFQRMRAFLRDEWSFITLRVTDVETEIDDVFGGLESDCEDYIKSTAIDMARGMNTQVVAALLTGCITDAEDEDDEIYETLAA